MGAGASWDDAQKFTVIASAFLWQTSSKASPSCWHVWKYWIDDSAGIEFDFILTQPRITVTSPHLLKPYTAPMGRHCRTHYDECFGLETIAGATALPVALSGVIVGYLTVFHATTSTLHDVIRAASHSSNTAQNRGPDTMRLGVSVTPGEVHLQFSSMFGLTAAAARDISPP